MPLLQSSDMAKIIKRNEEYFVQFYGNGLLFEKYAGADKKKAERVLKEIEESLPEGAMSNYVADQDVDAFFKEFLKESSKKYSKLTLSAFESAIKEFNKFMGSKIKGAKRLSKITPKVIEAYRDSRKKRDLHEVNFRLFLLGCIFDYAIKKTYLNDNPTFHITLLDVKEPPWLNEAELKERLSKADQTKQLIIKYLLGSIPLDERFKLLRWNDFGDDALRNTFIRKLLFSDVPLFKLYEIFKLDDITLLKPYTCWINK